MVNIASVWELPAMFIIENRYVFDTDKRAIPLENLNISGVDTEWCHTL
jgi:hypothetical protein